MFAPPLYRVRKYPLAYLAHHELRVPEGEDDRAYLIGQQDNALFRQIRLITGERGRRNPFVVFVDCKGAGEDTPYFLRLLEEGFTVGERRFVLGERSASMTRNGILSFVDEEIAEELSERVSMGLPPAKTVLSKWYAYRGLMLSSCHCIEGWVPKMIVVPDYYRTVPKQRIKYVCDRENRFVGRDGVERVGTQKDVAEDVRDITINVFDGCGVHHPAITRTVQTALGSEAAPTSMLIRLPFIKGVTHEVDYVRFFEERGVREITDLWGERHDVTASGEPMVILFESMYKGLGYFRKYGDARDWREYWERFHRYQHCFGVAKWNFSKEEERVYTRANYQILQDLDLPYPEFASLARDSVAWAERIASGDLPYTMCFLGLYADRCAPKNDYVRAVLRDQRMLQEPNVRGYLVSLMRKYMDDMKCGKLYLRSCFKFLVPDLMLALEHIGGLPRHGCLADGEFYASGRDGPTLGECAIERNPHICRSEHTVLRGVSSGELESYFSHLANVCMVNGKGIVMQRLQGADSDGDLVLVVQSDVVLAGIDRDAPIVLDIDDKVTVSPEEDTPENRRKIILRTMKNLIGEFSNYASVYHNKTPRSAEQRKKYEHYIDIIAVLTGKAIDYAKTGVLYLVPPYIAKFGRPLPYFMRYRKPYYARMKLSRGASNMNRLCWELERWEREVKFRRSRTTFDYRLMLAPEREAPKEVFSKIGEIYLEFCREMADLSRDQRSIREEIGEFQINWEYYYDRFRERCREVCPDEQTLADAAVRLCWEVYPKKSKKFPWIVAGDGILKNISAVPVLLPVEDPEGEIRYLGKRYRMEEKTID